MKAIRLSLFVLFVWFVVPFNVQAEEPEMQQWLYRLHPTRPGFAQQSTPDEDRVMDEHFQYLQTLTEEGVVLLAGPCLDYAMGIVIFVAESEAAALEIMRNDPSVKGGVLAADLHPFRAALVGDFEP